MYNRHFYEILQEINIDRIQIHLTTPLQKSITTEECPVCKETVELTKVEDHDDYKMRFYSCGHTSRLFQRSINEPPIEIKDEVSWIKTSDPIGAITRAKGSRNYYEAFSLSCTFFGDYGKKFCYGTQRTLETKSAKVN